jgi:2-polyprenyl-6-methoxyphenol hydroxylase-like FAD-dependent oxidoreductase
MKVRHRVQRLDSAIVIGGSIGGLLAARVLADYCRKVTVVERDEFPPVGQQRRGFRKAGTRTVYWPAAEP